MKTRHMMDKGIKILVVDDDNEMTTTFQVGLRSHGFEVDTYNDPQLALSKFKPGFYDLILLDIRMPNMTGFEYCEKVRKKDDSVKICFVTAFEEYYKGGHQLCGCSGRIQTIKVTYMIRGCCGGLHHRLWGNFTDREFRN